MNAEEIYAKEFEPLVDKLIALAQQHEFSMFVSVQRPANDKLTMSCGRYFSSRNVVAPHMWLAEAIFNRNPSDAKMAMMAAILQADELPNEKGQMLSSLDDADVCMCAKCVAERKRSAN